MIALAILFFLSIAAADIACSNAAPSLRDWEIDPSDTWWNNQFIVYSSIRSYTVTATCNVQLPELSTGPVTFNMNVSATPARYYEVKFDWGSDRTYVELNNGLNVVSKEFSAEAEQSYPLTITIDVLSSPGDGILTIDGVSLISCVKDPPAQTAIYVTVGIFLFAFILVAIFSNKFVKTIGACCCPNYCFEPRPFEGGPSSVVVDLD